MADEPLSFPRLMYRGKPDTLGLGPRPDPKTGELIGETKRVESQQDYDDAQKDGWRATREENADVAETASADRTAEEQAAADQAAADHPAPAARASRNALKR